MFKTVIALALILAADASKFHFQYDPSTTTACGTEEDRCGPEDWGKLPGAAACAGGPSSFQNPFAVHSKDAVTSNLTRPDFDVVGGGCFMWMQGANDHSFEVYFEKAGCNKLGVTFDGKSYELKRLHFHSPSEHTLNGKQYPAEVHFVHKSTDKSVLVIGSMLDVQEPNSIPANLAMLDAFWKGSETSVYNLTHVTNPSPLNPYLIFKPNTNMLHWMGSLTTPPCAVNIVWLMSEEFVRISPYDLTQLRSRVAAHPKKAISKSGDNNRPLQKRNDRRIERLKAPVERPSEL